MSISNKIRALMVMRGVKNREIATALGCSPQAVSNKMHRDTFTAADLVRIAEALDCRLSFTLPDGEQLRLTPEDLQEED